jgi:hypothetical protein
MNCALIALIEKLFAFIVLGENVLFKSQNPWQGERDEPPPSDGSTLEREKCKEG